MIGDPALSLIRVFFSMILAEKGDITLGRTQCVLQIVPCARPCKINGDARPYTFMTMPGLATSCTRHEFVASPFTLQSLAQGKMYTQWRTCARPEVMSLTP